MKLSFSQCPFCFELGKLNNFEFYCSICNSSFVKSSIIKNKYYLYIDKLKTYNISYTINSDLFEITNDKIYISFYLKNPTINKIIESFQKRINIL